MSLIDRSQLSPRFPAQNAVMDIGGGAVSNAIRSMLETRLLYPKASDRPLLPTASLYNDTGMKLWEQVTHLPTYYQTSDEIRLLEHHATALARHVVPGSILLDIGSGEARKIRPFIDALEALQIPVKYVALDLSRPALTKSMEDLAPRYQFVQCFGLWGTFDDAFAWAREIQQQQPSIWYLSLGSFFGNDHFLAAVERLGAWRSAMRREDRLLIGMDAQDNGAAVWASYHDKCGVLEQFMRNGLHNSNDILGHQWYKDEEWEVTGLLEEGSPITHKFVFRALCDVVCPGLDLRFDKGDEIDCYEVFKYGPDEMRKQFAAAGLVEITAFKAPQASFYEYLLMSDLFTHDRRTQEQSPRRDD